MSDVYMHACTLHMQTGLTSQGNVQAAFVPIAQGGPKPAQLLALQDAANGEGLIPELRCKYSRAFHKLFEGMLHPDAAQRMTAAQMLQVVQDASFKLLNMCPLRM